MSEKSENDIGRALVAEKLDSYRTDAMRYRYLRDAAKNDFPHPFIAIRSRINVVCQATGDTADFAVDQAINAALAKDKT